METNNNSFIFETPLIEGVICRRRKRFIMEVEVDGDVYDLRPFQLIYHPM